MNFSDEIKKALATYDKQKGFFRRFFWDPPGIRAVRRLSAQANLTDLFKAYLSFHSFSWFPFFFSPPEPSQTRYKVYEVLAKHANLPKNSNYPTYSLLKNIDTAGFLTKENINIFVKLHPSKLGDPDPIRMMSGDFINAGISSIIKKLSKKKLLTEATFRSVSAHTNPCDLFLILENINHLLTPKTPGFLFTEECYQIAWNRMPRRLWTDKKLKEIIRIAGEENPEQRMTQHIDRLLGINQQNQDRITVNNAQNTHYGSVHQSTSNSASKLYSRYRQVITKVPLEKALDTIQAHVAHLPNDSIENKAAKRCFKRIRHLNYIDPKSQLSIPQLVVLTFFALQDNKKRLGSCSLADAQKQFIQGLYEIQRGYNLSETGVDDGHSVDKTICASGTFNKLLEKLAGIHADAEILHITPTVATFKLQAVVREVAIAYLAKSANVQTTEDFHKFTRLIAQIKNDGCVDAIWNEIKTEIAHRLFDEFSSLYKNKMDPKFTELVASGQYSKLDDLSRFQKQILGSPGYQQYCSESLKNSMRFFPILKNAEAQQTYQRPGLTLK